MLSNCSKYAKLFFKLFFFKRSGHRQKLFRFKDLEVKQDLKTAETMCFRYHNLNKAPSDGEKPARTVGR